MQLTLNNAEAKLLEFVIALENYSNGYYAIHFNLSHLDESYSSTYQINIAVNILSDVFRNEEGILFRYSNNDIVVLYKGSNKKTIEKAIFQLRYLFMDDSIAYTEKNIENENFSTVYDLDFQLQEFTKKCKGILLNEDSESKENKYIISKLKNNYNSLGVLTPYILSKIIKEIEHKDISSCFRQQPICTYKNQRFKVIFKEIYAVIDSIKKILNINIDFLSNRTLFKYFTTILDKHTLQLFQMNPILPSSININIKTLMSEDFVKFDQQLDSKMKPSIAFEISLSDIFENYHNFIITKDAVQKLGYKICLDGLDSLNFIHIDKNFIGFDLIKIKWSEDLLSNSNSQRLRDFIDKDTSSRIILYRCDSKKSIDFGKEIGIHLFQGTYIDQNLNH